MFYKLWLMLSILYTHIVYCIHIVVQHVYSDLNLNIVLDNLQDLISIFKAMSEWKISMFWTVNTQKIKSDILDLKFAANGHFEELKGLFRFGTLYYIYTHHYGSSIWVLMFVCGVFIRALWKYWEDETLIETAMFPCLKMKTNLFEWKSKKLFFWNIFSCLLRYHSSCNPRVSWSFKMKRKTNDVQN